MSAADVQRLITITEAGPVSEVAPGVAVAELVAQLVAATDRQCVSSTSC
jgi:hypothetical protein